MERLQKYIARCGVASRRAAEALIAEGRVRVNGQVIRELGNKVEPDLDHIEVDGAPVRPTASRRYLVLNKPPGVVTTTSDPWGRPTVMEQVPRLGRLYPVGRLDADSEGLILLTDDGELANRLMHPRYGCEKEYRALVAGRPQTEVLQQLRSGVALEDGRTAPARVDLERCLPDSTCWLRIVLTEGRKRQVRRMLAAVRVRVLRLQRIRIGPILLDDLPVGASRPLGRSEVAALRDTTAGQDACKRR